MFGEHRAQMSGRSEWRGRSLSTLTSAFGFREGDIQTVFGALSEPSGPVPESQPYDRLSHDEGGRS